MEVKTVTEINSSERRQKRRKIALVVDRPEWALDHIADQVIKNLSDEFDFRRIYAIDIDNFVDVLIVAADCDIVHMFWRGLISCFDDVYCQDRIHNLGITREEFVEKYVKGKIISTEVYDHLLLTGQDYEITKKIFAHRESICTNYAVSSMKLLKIYNGLPDLRLRPQAICQDGVDLTLFQPDNLCRFDTIGTRKVYFGWAGNSKWATGDLKGINTIIRPAIEELKSEGYPVELVTSDRLNRLIPHDEMPNFSHSLDCYICASTGEGTPNPVLEAMACGVPVISTDVGIVPEVFGAEQKKYIMSDRSVESLKSKIVQLLNEEDGFRRLSNENLRSIRNWDWKIKVEKIRKYFHDCLQADGVEQQRVQ